jgi:hypothetical protein
MENVTSLEINDVTFPTLQEIYKKSKVNWEEFMDECIILSIKTSNSQSEIDNMEFYKFRSLIRSLNKYIEAERKQENGENPENDLSKKSSEMMSNAKNMVGSFKAPKAPKLPKK